MLIVGLTGSIGMGKSTASQRLQHHGLAVFDADAAVHELYAGKAVPLIEEAFPGSIHEGVVDRQALSALLDGKQERFRVLEAIVHPLVRVEERAFLAGCHRRNAIAAVLEIPLLYETGFSGIVDVVIVVSAPADVQRSRVLARPGMTVEKFEAIVMLQVPDAEKRAKADFVVDTSGSIEASQRQIDDIVLQLPNLESKAYEVNWN